MVIYQNKPKNITDEADWTKSVWILSLWVNQKSEWQIKILVNGKSMLYLHHSLIVIKKHRYKSNILNI